MDMDMDKRILQAQLDTVYEILNGDQDTPTKKGAMETDQKVALDILKAADTPALLAAAIVLVRQLQRRGVVDTHRLEGIAADQDLEDAARAAELTGDKTLIFEAQNIRQYKQR